MNNLKNWSLYATQIENAFVRPSDVITEEIARVALEHTRTQLQSSEVEANLLALATGGTEAGLRQWLEAPDFQIFAQIIEGIAGTSEEPVVKDQQIAQEMMRELLTNPAVNELLTQYSQLLEQRVEIGGPPTPNE